jgi:pimeloyl-ACP methyl ester carboxylesterase
MRLWRYALVVVAERDVRLDDGRTVHAYDTGALDADGIAVVWHHGSPQTGAVLEPLVAAAADRNIRILSYGRPSYGGSSPRPGRTVASAAADVAQVADAHGVHQFAVMGASGGGPHALACAALFPQRVTGVVSIAGLAPLSGSAFATDTSEWFYGMASPGGLRSALSGRDARAQYAARDAFDPESFTEADWTALSESWASLGADVARSENFGVDGLIDDDVAFVSPWGFELQQISARVLIVQGGEDRVVPPTHSMWLLNGCRQAELWLRPRDGHISVLDACPVAMDWLRDAVSRQ